MFSTYPFDYFGGGIKFLLYTAVPTAFISATPDDLVEQFTWQQFVALAAVAGAFSIGARATFTRALRSYTSGSRWTSA